MTSLTNYTNIAHKYTPRFDCFGNIQVNESYTDCHEMHFERTVIFIPVWPIFTNASDKHGYTRIFGDKLNAKAEQE